MPRFRAVAVCNKPENKCGRTCIASWKTCTKDPVLPSPTCKKPPPACQISKVPSRPAGYRNRKYTPPKTPAFIRPPSRTFTRPVRVDEGFHDAEEDEFFDTEQGDEFFDADGGAGAEHCTGCSDCA